LGTTKASGKAVEGVKPPPPLAEEEEAKEEEAKERGAEEEESPVLEVSRLDFLPPPKNIDFSNEMREKKKMGKLGIQKWKQREKNRKAK
jgi:hypothetical protein